MPQWYNGLLTNSRLKWLELDLQHSLLATSPKNGGGGEADDKTRNLQMKTRVLITGTKWWNQKSINQQEHNMQKKRQEFLTWLLGSKLHPASLCPQMNTASSISQWHVNIPSEASPPLANKISVLLGKPWYSNHVKLPPFLPIFYAL